MWTALLLVPIMVVWTIKPAFAEPPLHPLESFAAAKQVARDVIYSDHHETLYCGCDFAPTETRSGGNIDPIDCGYVPRANPTRGERLEWEHIVPAWFFDHTRNCWTEGHEMCVRSDGTRYKGRDCCVKADREFRLAEGDLHNLAPAVGELNGDRSNHPYGMVEGEPREYGTCDFEVGGTPKVVEPREVIRGDVARVWLYMSDTYDVQLSYHDWKMLEDWAAIDPVDDWEILRDQRIEAAQSNRNHYVRP